MEEEKKVVIKLKKQPLESEIREMKALRLKKLLKVLLCLLLLSIGVIGGYFFASVSNSYYYSNEHSKFDKIANILKKDWLYKDDDLIDSLEDKALYGMTYFEDDPYTTYLSSDDLEEFTSSINMNFVGVGITYSSYGGKAMVISVIKDAPAYIAGVLPGDYIISVDGKTIDENNVNNLKDLVMGEEGSPVVLGVLRNNETIQIPIVRAAINNTVNVSQVEDIVVLNIDSFGESTNDECVKLLEPYKDSSKLVIDLRNNGGGYQDSVMKVAGLFVGADKVFMKEEFADGHIEEIKTVCTESFENFKDIVIVVNASTASASEVMAIALKELHPNCKIIGTASYGKGVAQKTIMIEGDSALKYTNCRWYSPSGYTVDKVGVPIDEEVKQDEMMYINILTFKQEANYKYDDVSGYIEIAQMALDYLDYEVKREDGYFDESLTDALKLYQADHSLEITGELNYETYYSLVAQCNFISNTVLSKDYQLSRAIELLGN